MNEAAGTATFTVSLSNPSASTVSVSYGTSNGTATAGADYTSGTGTLSFAPGVVTQTVTVAIGNDAVFEGAESFQVNLSSPSNATLADAVGVGTIRDDGTGTGGIDNDTPVISVNCGQRRLKAARYAVFTVSLSNAEHLGGGLHPEPGHSRHGTASGTDTVPASALDVSTDGGTTWTSAGRSATVSIAGRLDQRSAARWRPSTTAIAEAERRLHAHRDTHRSAAARSPRLGHRPPPPSSDNDGTPSLSRSTTSPSTRAAGTATFTVTLSPSAVAACRSRSVSATSNGTASCRVPTSQSATGTLTFAPGVTSQTVTVAICRRHGTFEGSEAFNVNLSSRHRSTRRSPTTPGVSARSATTAPAPAAPTMTRRRSLSISSPTVAEGDGFAVFTVSLSNPSATDTTVSLATTAGTATSPADFGNALRRSPPTAARPGRPPPPPPSPPGQTSVLVRASIVNDTHRRERRGLHADRHPSRAGTTSNAARSPAPPRITDNDATLDADQPRRDVTSSMKLRAPSTFTVTLVGSLRPAGPASRLQLRHCQWQQPPSGADFTGTTGYAELRAWRHQPRPSPCAIANDGGLRRQRSPTQRQSLSGGSECHDLRTASVSKARSPTTAPAPAGPTTTPRPCR